MSLVAPSVIKKVVDRGLGEVVRTAQIFEADGVTPWRSDDESRLLDGSVTINYGSAERRTLDITLRNNDNALRSTPGGFWYDKIIKVNRGVRYSAKAAPPSSIIAEFNGTAVERYRLAAKLARVGLAETNAVETAPGYAVLDDYDIIISHTGGMQSTRAAELRRLYEAGKSIITISNANSSAQVFFLQSGFTTSGGWGISQMPSPTIYGAGWTTEVTGTGTGTAHTALVPGAVAISRWLMDNSSYAITASIMSHPNGGKWLDLHLPAFDGANVFQLTRNVVPWLQSETDGSMIEWSTQIGEFMIDSINSDYFPSAVKVSGRDYTKKCMNTKIENGMSFGTGTRIDTIVAALAGNSGVTKRRLVEMPETLTAAASFDRGTPRWEVMQKLSDINGYELFFDREGYLTSRKYLDPTLSPETQLFQTGAEGNLQSINRKVSDNRIYNHIVVFGDPPSGDQRMPFGGQATNTNPNSPTRVAKIGRRYYSYASTFFSSQAQCQQYAQNLLGLHALESFEMTFGSIAYPWMDVGEIVRVNDPQAVNTDPDKFLVDSMTMPLALGPMSFTGKRVTMVG